jgi:FkbM family methyltransferase
VKRKILKFANALISPFGAQLYKSGFDMESAIQAIAAGASDIGTVIDIGASDGRWSEMAMLYFKSARFLAIDPLAEREGGLRRLRQKDPRFDYQLCAAGENDNETVQLAVGDDLDGSTVGGASGVSRTVPSHSIDALVQSGKCAGRFVLKFDTHGFEVPILKGATRTLAITDYIVMEVYNFRHTPGTLLFHEMCGLLDGHGFRCLKLVDPMVRPLDGSFWQVDLVFARHTHPAFRENGYRRT